MKCMVYKLQPYQQSRIMRRKKKTHGSSGLASTAAHAMFRDIEVSSGVRWAA
jgi:hypothetical protein